MDRAKSEGRRRREREIRAAYDLPDDLFSPEGMKRLMEIAIHDTLALDSSRKRGEVLMELIETAEQLNRRHPHGGPPETGLNLSMDVHP